ncbi:fungal-specific transcription factor domain-containing protein [Lipomyces chichibuensis]|uniref:fungal-specific transcription factor domain-containing protein n=1 Tax=Lipomyces chichibuensis TaxID=1546026 RepID=UPI003342FB1E
MTNARPNISTGKGKGTGRGSRSSIACTKCHASKIKCDVSIHGSPCSRCKERGVIDCELIQSRRGTYDRKEWLKKVKARKEEEEKHERQMKTQSEIIISCSSPSSSPSSSDDSSLSPPPPQLIEPVQTTAACEKQGWNLMIESFLDHQKSVVNKTPVSYFGESFPMSFLLQNQHSKSGHIRLRRSSDQHDPAEHPKHITVSKLAFLADEKCFTKLDRAVLDQLIMTYFHKVHSVLPILDRTSFLRLYKAGKVPWLLLQSVCFSAASYCPVNALCRDSGCGSTRREARMMFYRRAKLLFDFGYETDKLTLVQSSILLSFWGGQPHEYWNTSSWLNAAVNIAESLGMHRAVRASDLEDSEKALRRRIWWVLVVRDSFSAALLGKPLRINMSQSDVQQLQLNDFESDSDPPDDVDKLFGSRVRARGMYAIETTKLSMILRDIVSARSANAITTTFVLAVLKRLDSWHTSLPQYLNLGKCPSTSDLNVLASALSVMYYHNLIYLYQMSLPSVMPYTIAQDAVNQITEIGSNLVMRSEILDMPQDAFGSFFMAMVLLFTSLRTKSGNVRLHRTQLKICEMIVYQVQECWDHADWILPLCDTLRRKLDVLWLTTSSNQAVKAETTIESLMSDVEFDEIASNIGGILDPSYVASPEKDLFESTGSIDRDNALLGGGQTELNAFNETDEFLTDIDTFSTVLGM